MSITPDKSERSATTRQKLLYEVSLIRPFVIFLLVVMHSFTKIAAGGIRTNDYQLPDVYQWLCHIISGFRIETIALVAGYVFAYQSIVLHRKYELKTFVVKKFKRLILPMLFFGLFYYVMFLYTPSTFSVGSFLLKWFSGCGHLWFLPMLFWCFLTIWMIDHFHLSSWKTLVVLALLAILPLPFYRLPLGLARLPHFLFFVYGGYYLYEHRDVVMRNGLSLKAISTFWLFYLTLIVSRHTWLDGTPMLSPVFRKAFLNNLNLFISCVGIVALYCTICSKTKDVNYAPPQLDYSSKQLLLWSLCVPSIPSSLSLSLHKHRSKRESIRHSLDWPCFCLFHLLVFNKSHLTHTLWSLSYRLTN